MLNYNEKHLVPLLRLRSWHNKDKDKEKEKIEQLISQVFGHFDQNHDGVLDYAELQRVKKLVKILVNKLW